LLAHVPDAVLKIESILIQEWFQIEVPLVGHVAIEMGCLFLVFEL
jgi:hypothetical protein